MDIVVQKLYGPEISRLLPYLQQFLYNLRRLIIFHNYIEEINHFTLDLPKRPILNAEPSEKFLIVDNSKEDHKEREFKR